MACPYLNDKNSYLCVTGGEFCPNDECLNEFCKNPKKFNECATFREWTRVQGAPRMIKILAFAIPILLYLNLLSLALILELIKINDSITYFFGVIALTIGIAAAFNT